MDWKAKLTSRKLWVALSEFIGMLLVAFGVAEDTVTQVVALVMAGAGALAYIIAEGLVDAKSASNQVAIIPPGSIVTPADEGTDPDGNN